MKHARKASSPKELAQCLREAMIEKQAEVRRSQRLLEHFGGLEAFARSHPASDEFREIRREGQRSNYPPCCIEFFCACFPLVWRYPVLEVWYATKAT